MPAKESKGCGFKPWSGHLTGVFIYRFISATTFGAVTRMTTVRAKGIHVISPGGEKKYHGISPHLPFLCHGMPIS